MSDFLAIVLTVTGIVAGLIATWVFVRPHIQRVGAAADAILGEETVRDRSGEEIQPPRPGLVHRVGTVETTLALMVENSDRLNDHESRLQNLEAARLERVVAQAESAQMWKAIGDKDVDLGGK